MDLKIQILEKAEDLFLRYGLKSVTMDDIARKLGNCVHCTFVMRAPLL